MFQNAHLNSSSEPNANMQQNCFESSLGMPRVVIDALVSGNDEVQCLDYYIEAMQAFLLSLQTMIY